MSSVSSVLSTPNNRKRQLVKSLNVFKIIWLVVSQWVYKYLHMDVVFTYTNNLFAQRKMMKISASAYLPSVWNLDILSINNYLDGPHRSINNYARHLVAVWQDDSLSRLQTFVCFVYNLLLDCISRQCQGWRPSSPKRPPGRVCQAGPPTGPKRPSGRRWDSSRSTAREAA